MLKKCIHKSINFTLQNHDQILTELLSTLTSCGQIRIGWAESAKAKGQKKSRFVMYRDSDRLFRWGGEEFIIIMPGTSLSGARIIAERMRSGVELTPYLDGSIVLECTISVGLCGKDVGKLQECLEEQIAIFTRQNNQDATELWNKREALWSF